MPLAVDFDPVAEARVFQNVVSRKIVIAIVFEKFHQPSAEFAFGLLFCPFEEYEKVVRSEQGLDVTGGALQLLTIPSLVKLILLLDELRESLWVEAEHFLVLKNATLRVHYNKRLHSVDVEFFKELLGLIAVDITGNNVLIHFGNFLKHG